MKGSEIDIEYDLRINIKKKRRNNLWMIFIQC